MSQDKKNNMLFSGEGLEKGGKTFKIIDLFSGAGGFSYGFKKLGFKHLLGVDIDEWALESWKINIGAKILQADISRLTYKKILKEVSSESPTVIIASPPCEAYTEANPKREKDPMMRFYDDERGVLSYHAIRLIGDLSPEVFVIENVTGITEGSLKQIIRKELKRAGYNNVYFNLLRGHEMGLPSFRKRVFISNVRIPQPRETTIVPCEEALKDLPPCNKPHDVPNHDCVPTPKKYVKKIVKVKWGQALLYFWGSRRSMKNYVRLNPTKIAPTVMGKSRFVHPTEHRLLTPREHARLMSYPDSYRFIGNIERVYNQVGESVPPLMSMHVAKIVLENLLGHSI